MFLLILIVTLISHSQSQTCDILQNVTLSGDLNSTSCATSLCTLATQFTQPIFGDPSSPDCSITTDGTLTEDLFCDNIMLSAGVTLHTNGYKIFAANAFAILGTISNTGGNAGLSSGGSGAPNGTLGGGSDGGFTSTQFTSASGMPVQGVNPVAGASMGGAGGQSGGAGGAVNVSESGVYTLDYFIYLNTLHDLYGNVFAGGSGGGSGTFNLFGSGNGGGGGGVIAIFAKTIMGNGVITADGGSGSTGQGATDGGGGGGGGGFIYIVTGHNMFIGSIHANGGSAGANGGSGGSTPQNGQAGFVKIKVLPGF